MKITISISLFYLLGLVTLPIYASEYKCLVLWHANGSQTVIGLYKEPRLTFDAKSIIVYSPVLEMTFPKSEILKYTFEDKAAETAIEMIRKDQLEFLVTSTQIIVKGPVSNAKVFLFNISGKIIPVSVNHVGEGIQISLSSIAKGIYVLSVGDQSIKFSKL